MDELSFVESYPEESIISMFNDVFPEYDSELLSIEPINGGMTNSNYVVTAPDENEKSVTKYRSVDINKFLASVNPTLNQDSCSGVIDSNIFRERSLLLINLISGRTHQIRKHLKMIGHPIVGDKRYGGKKAGCSKKDDILNLFAIELDFICPFDKQKKNFKIDFKNIPFLNC